MNEPSEPSPESQSPPEPPPEIQRAAADLYLAMHCNADHFTAQLYRLIQKADADNRALLAHVYPVQVFVWEQWMLHPDERQFFGVVRVGEYLRDPIDRARFARFVDTDA